MSKAEVAEEDLQLETACKQDRVHEGLDWTRTLDDVDFVVKPPSEWRTVRSEVWVALHLEAVFKAAYESVAEFDIPHGRVGRVLSLKEDREMRSFVGRHSKHFGIMEIEPLQPVPQVAREITLDVLEVLLIVGAHGFPLVRRSLRDFVIL